jgi:peptide/nickel transport system permease protein
MLGIIAGYFGGITETFIMRFMDVISPIPTILLGIAIASAFGQSLVSLMIAVGVVSVPSFARIARASVMTVRDQEYIEAAKSMSASDLQIIVSHIIPNSFAPILVQATMRVASAIIAASSLSFLGLGVPAPQPEWGGMLSEGRSFIRSNTNMTLFPGIAIMITVLSINLIGDGVRDAMDPRLKR